MKNNKTIFALLILFLGACNKVSLDKDFTETLNNLEIPKGSRNSAGVGPYDVLGHGYDVTGFYAESSSAGFQIIDIARFKQDFSARVIDENPRIQEYKEDYGENSEQYSKSISNRASATTGFKLFGLSISGNFYSSNDESSSFDIKYIYGSYKLLIKQKRYRLNASVVMLQNYLTPEFTFDLQNKSASQILRDYGTHVMIDIYTGGKFNMLYQAETSNEDRTLAARAGLKLGAHGIFNMSIADSNSVDISASQQNYSKRIAYKALGGDPTQQIRGLINIDFSTPSISLTAWQNSVTPNNSVLVDFGQHGLIPIYDLIIDPIKKNELTLAVNQYIINGSVKNKYKRVPVYHLYLDGWANFKKSKMENHILTLFPKKEDRLMQNVGIVFYAYDQAKPGTVPIHRYRSEKLQDNFYTTVKKTYKDYKYERVEFYAYPTSNAEYPLRPIYRYWSPKIHWDHYYSTVNAYHVNYVSEGIEFYVPQ